MSSINKKFDYLKLPLTSIQTATKNFAQENLIGKGRFGYIYKGQLLRSEEESIDIVARRLNTDMYGQGSRQFQKEITTLSSMKHPNLTSIVGFCDQNGEKIIVYKFEANGSLDQHLNNDRITLTWTQRLHICLAIARALSYIHYDEGRDFSVIHRNIKSSKFLLGDKWEPKLAGFGISTTQPIAQRHGLVLDSPCGTPGYVDPEYLRSGSVTHKSDVYSFGVVLFEVLSGRKALFPDKQSLARLVRSHYKTNGNVNDIIHPGLRMQMDLESLKIFSDAGYRCLNDKREQRPNIDQVVIALEQALELQLAHERSFIIKERSTPANDWKGKNLVQLKIDFNALKSATENFSAKYVIQSGGYGLVYKAELDHFDSRGSKGNAGSEHSMRSSNVVIKFVTYREETQEEKHFYTTIELLASCMHPNIVSLLGYCYAPPHMILVYEYASRGSLEDYLDNEEMTPNLTWTQRIKICIDVARGLDYIHTAIDGKQEMIHGDIKSVNILLDNNWEAKIADFGLHKYRRLDYTKSTIITNKVASTQVYIDPEYEWTGKMKKESDVYSFGVVLFEILSGRVAYDSVYTSENEKGLAPIARQHFEKGTIRKIVDIKLKVKSTFRPRKGPDQLSLDTFSVIGYKCLARKQVDRPTMKMVIEELEKALKFQAKKWGHLKIGLDAIQLATENFSVKYVIGSGGYCWVYKAELKHFDSCAMSDQHKALDQLPRRRSTVALKRLFHRQDAQGEEVFFTEIETLHSCKHHNVVSLLGFCYERPEMILVYEHVSNGSLDDYLSNKEKKTNLTWMQRIKICIDVARGLHYLHTTTDHKQKIIHRDIKSANILLSENLEAKIADFGLCKLDPLYNMGSTINATNVAGTPFYLDPEYDLTGKLKNESDVYSFGVVLFEIMSGILAYDEVYTNENEKGLASIVRERFKNGTIKDMLDPNLKEPNQVSLNIFSTIGHGCLAEKQADRPTMEVVIEELKKALKFQESHNDGFRISFEDVRLATDNFSNQIAQGAFGKVYIGEILLANGPTPIAVKRNDKSNSQGEKEFLTEVEILCEYKHENIIGLVGYCDENNEKILVYEYAYNSSLDKHLIDANLTWKHRLKIAIDVAMGLEFIHGGGPFVIHRDIKSADILLDADWKAKISDFGLSVTNNEIDFAANDVRGTHDLIDQQLAQWGFLTKESDIYSLGVVLCEMVSGSTMTVSMHLVDLVKRCYEQGKVDKLVFEGINVQIVPASLIAFVKIAYECLHDEIEKRPTASEVVVKLNEALKLQKHGLWDFKLPRDYKEIIQMSKTPEILNKSSNKEIYNMFLSGIVLQKGKVCFSLGSNGQRNEVVSATTFSYEKDTLHKCKSIKNSRFQRVVKIMNISNLRIQIKIETRFLSPNVIYGAYLVFKFCEPRKLSSRQMYVNLKYKMGSKTWHAYFATHIDDGWMSIELCRLIPHKKDIDFEVVLESLSRYYCGSGAICIEGVHFRAINDATLKVKPYFVQQVSVDYEEITQIPELVDGEKVSSLSNANEKQCHLLPAKMCLYESGVKCYNWKSEPGSRFGEVAEVLSRQIIRVKYENDTKKLSPDTHYACYIVFKLSEKCRGLQCPVKVRDELHRKNKEFEVIYFRSPRSVNFHGNERVPKRREDGLMEVVVLEFNSSKKLSGDHLRMNLKLICYEGTMSGLIVYGIECRPI